MRKLLNLSIVLVTSLWTLNGCTSVSPVSSETPTTQNQNNQQTPPESMPGDMPPLGIEPGGIGFAQELNLTSEQQEQIMQLRSQIIMQPIDSSKIEQLRSVVSSSFQADTFSVSELTSKISDLNLIDTDSVLNSQADTIVKTYNILTTEQKATLANNNIPIFDMRSPANIMINLGVINTLTNNLNLDDSQKTSLHELIGNPVDFNNSASTDLQAAINTELNTGNATNESIKNVLSQNISSVISTADMDKLSEVHALLNTEQRKQIVENIGLLINSQNNGQGMPPVAPPSM